MAAVGVLVVEVAWALDFFGKIIFNRYIFHLSDYMFDSQYPFLLRILSLFHLFTPIIWIIYLTKYGYDPRALYYFTLLYWIILIHTYFFTNPQENINWVFLPQTYKWRTISPISWVIILAIIFPLLVFLPMHYFLLKISG